MKKKVPSILWVGKDVPSRRTSFRSMGAKIEDIKKAIDDAQPEDESPEQKHQRTIQARGTGLYEADQFLKKRNKPLT